MKILKKEMLKQIDDISDEVIITNDNSAINDKIIYCLENYVKEVRTRHDSKLQYYI